MKLTEATTWNRRSKVKLNSQRYFYLLHLIITIIIIIITIIIIIIISVYISNNKVRARIVEPNIPVANGVIHVIDDLLFYIYRNLKQKIEVIPNLR